MDVAMPFPAPIATPHRIRDLHLAVGTIGRAAHEVLQSSTGGRVVAVFQRSLYLQSAQDEVLCLASHNLPPGPLNALFHAALKVDWTASGVRAGDQWWRCAEALVIDGGWRFHLHGASIWRPPVCPSRPQAGVLARALQRVRDHALGRDPGLMFRCVLAHGRGPGSRPVTSALTRRTHIAVGAMLEWVQRAWRHPAQPQAVPKQGLDLIGLGIGLTPSGDDFLGGLMVASKALGAGAVFDPLAAWVRAKVGARTSTISRAHLLAACEGEAAAPLHDAIEALLRPDARIEEALNAVAEMGHSSGWDAFAGVYAACTALGLESRHPRTV